MEKIISWLEGCGFSHDEAVKEANTMIKRSMYDGYGNLLCSREYAIQEILEDIEDMKGVSA